MVVVVVVSVVEVEGEGVSDEVGLPVDVVVLGVVCLKSGNLTGTFFLYCGPNPILSLLEVLELDTLTRVTISELDFATITFGNSVDGVEGPVDVAGLVGAVVGALVVAEFGVELLGM